MFSTRQEVRACDDSDFRVALSWGPCYVLINRSVELSLTFSKSP